MWIKIFYIDNIIGKVLCAAFFIYIFNFTTRFCNTFIDIKLLLIHYLRSEIAINVYQITLNNNSYQ